MPRKSQSEMLTAPLTTKSIERPYVVLVKNIRLLPAVPVVVRAPVVSEAVRDIVRTPAPDDGVMVSELTDWAVSTVAVNLPPELASKIASSTDVGTDAPDAPPDEVDHLVVDDQLPAPPTQYLAAKITLLVQEARAVGLRLPANYQTAVASWPESQRQ